VVLNIFFSSVLSTGLGADVVIGDAGTNTITTTMDIPRIFQIYRSFASPIDSGYAPNGSDFGFVFTSKFNLHPNPQRLTDAQGLSMIDELLTLEDIMLSNVLRDVIGVSSIKTDHDFCMQPIFRVIPGFVSKTHMLHGNDIIESIGGDDILIGDDIRGFSAIDLSELADVENSRQELDNLVVDLSIRLSTLGYDTEFYSGYFQNQTDEYRNLTVGCDSITTSIDSKTFAVGDTLTVLGRTFIGGSFPFSEQHFTQLFEHVKDVHQVLVDLHYALYEVHFDLLKRSMTLADLKESQQPLHSLRLGDDTFSSSGYDTIVGDSATLFFQIDSLLPGFVFDVLSNDDARNLVTALSAITNQRQSALRLHVEMDLVPTTPFSSQEKSALPFADVPFYLSVGNDQFDLFNNSVLAVGDFGSFGVVYSDNVTSLNDLRKYADSVHKLRKMPSVASFFPALSSLDNLDRFFFQRYDTTVSNKVEPQLHGDKFFGFSSKNVMFGDTLTAIGFAIGEGETFLDKTLDFYDTFLNAEYAIFFDSDYVFVPSNSSGTPIWVGQFSNDIVDGVVGRKAADAIIESQVRCFFDTHSIAKQVTSDFRQRIPFSFETKVVQNVCYNVVGSYVPSHTQSIYIEKAITTRSPTAAQMSSPAPTPQTTMPSTSDPTYAKPNTQMPTNLPTKPMRAPTKSPTKKPTRAPARTPTKSPTRTPTKSPTKAPTKSPTKRPTRVPK
jgi:hypothetical protein